MQKKIQTTYLSYRGGRIFNGIMDDLLAKGMANATNAILSEGSAGGLAVILHCDRFTSRLSPSARVKCLSDSAYFLHDEYLMGDKLFDITFEGLIELQGSAPMLPSSCLEKQIKPSLCFFPQYILQGIMTPLFLIMSSFDRVQQLCELKIMVMD
ncbi:pectin acetylesterase 11-like [Ipomoea triloba]|uniref:pectin acetylesterase 11-like n=1 Tax=Ipomoea triloba TaxID=35885 RepID=UPI00125D364F|nr:pectin acetylesterase 11-like [Ipomoea triloba]